MMPRRYCRYFLFAIVLVQAVVIVWLVSDIMETSSLTQQRKQYILGQPHPLTIRELQVKELDETISTEAYNSTQATGKGFGKEPLLEKSNLPARTLTDNEQAGNNIMITIRTTKKFHQKRLPMLYDTWLTAVNGSNVFLVTDGEDDEYEEKSKKLGINYVIISCGKNYGRWSLCCKSGEEMALMHRPENKNYDWFCHLDDDIYIIMKNLIGLLSKMNPKIESRYVGRAGTPWKKPRSLHKNQTLIKDTTRKFHFAVGGMYCLSRPMLEKVKPWLGNGQVMGDTCNKLLEPEDVTVGTTIELLANESLSRTRLFHPHGLILAKYVNPRTLKQQIGFAYGCGQLCGYKGYENNAVKVPHPKFNFHNDPSRFKSLHCHIFPRAPLCQ